MLVDKGFSPNDIVGIKLVSNEELVAKFVGENSTHVTISKPLILSLTMTDNSGRPNIQMFPFFMLGAEDDVSVSLRKDHIIAMVKSRDDVKNGYIRNTSGLVMPGQNDSNLIK